MEFLYNILLQLLFSVGAIGLVGFILAMCKMLLTKACGRGAYWVICGSGVIGTPVHEIGHALFCIIFGHKIVEMKLFQMGAESKTLGYVNHTYNPKNFYHKLGNFFIAVGPIILGSGIIALLMWLMIPTTFNGITQDIASLGQVDFTSSASIGQIFTLLWGSIVHLFTLANLANGWWWLFMIIATLISLHMVLSKVDIKGGWSGLILVIIVFIAVNAILYFTYRPAMAMITSFFLSLTVFLLSFTMVSVAVYLIMTVLAIVVRGIAKLFKK